MNNNTKFLLMALGLAFLVYVLWMCNGTKKEKFGNDGTWGMNGPIGGLVDNTAYDMVEPSTSTFADIVAPSEPATRCDSNLPLPSKAGANIDHRDLLPDVNTHATSYDIDVSDPEVFMWRPSIQTVIHNRQHQTADPLRGDLPIVKDGCGYSNNGWFSSRYNEGDAKLDSYFSDFSKAKFRSLTGQKSYPSYVANEGTIMDFQPTKSDEMVMDWY